MVGLIAVVGAGDPGRVVDVEPAPRPEHRAPVNGRDADGHQGDSKPSEQPGWLGAGSLGEAHQEPAVTTLEPGDCESPAVAHHANPTVSFVIAALFAYSTLTAAAPLSEISPRLGLPSRPPRGLRLQSRPDSWLSAFCRSRHRRRESFQRRVRNTTLSVPFHLPLFALIVQVRQLQSSRYPGLLQTFLSNLPQLYQAGSCLCMLADLPACT